MLWNVIVINFEKFKFFVNFYYLFAEIHNSLVEACRNNDVDKLPQCILSEKGLIKFLQGDVLYSNKNKFDKFIPGNYMYIACEHNSYAVVEQLLLLGIWDVNTPGINNKSAMLIACEKGNLEVLLLNVVV